MSFDTSGKREIRFEWIARGPKVWACDVPILGQRQAQYKITQHAKKLVLTLSEGDNYVELNKSTSMDVLKRAAREHYNFNFKIS